MAEIQISGYTVLVDDEDVEEIQKYRWYVVRKKRSPDLIYFVKSIKKEGRFSSIGLHRFLLGLDVGDGTIVDHINRNTLDNRKTNLRLCSVKENTRNTRGKQGASSQYKGVHLIVSYNKWRATINVEGSYYSLGNYTNEEEAAVAYDKAATYYYKEFAYVNFPENNYTSIPTLEQDVQELVCKNYSSKYKGVNKTPAGYTVYIRNNNLKYYLGIYQKEEDAAIAYDVAVDLLHLPYRKYNISKVNRAEYIVNNVATCLDRKSNPDKYKPSVYKGVYHRDNGRWRALVSYRGKNYQGGTFNTEYEAAVARDYLAYSIDENAYELNFPERVVDGVYNKEVL